MSTKQMSAIGTILADTARDLAYAQVQGKPLGRIQTEAAARIAAHYTRKCRAQGCTNEAYITDFCRECDDRSLGGDR